MRFKDLNVGDCFLFNGVFCIKTVLEILHFYPRCVCIWSDDNIHIPGVSYKVKQDIEVERLNGVFGYERVEVYDD